jgi:hypothetical protein
MTRGQTTTIKMDRFIPVNADKMCASKFIISIP